MKKTLIGILERFGYPVFQQGSLSKEDAYPDAFFTFWNNESIGNVFYDNIEYSCIWFFDVNFYATDPELVDKTLEAAKAALTKQGFIVSGKGYDVESDEPTHTGRGIQALMKEEEK